MPAWDGKRIIGYALLHATPPASLLRGLTKSTLDALPPPLSLPPPASGSEGTASPTKGSGGFESDEDEDAAPKRPVMSTPTKQAAPLDLKAKALRAALGAAGASRKALDEALPLESGAARELTDVAAGALRSFHGT